MTLEIKYGKCKGFLDKLICGTSDREIERTITGKVVLIEKRFDSCGFTGATNFTLYDKGFSREVYTSLSPEQASLFKEKKVIIKLTKDPTVSKFGYATVENIIILENEQK
jgi:hypothetical protein